jgi:hypothetical protein
MSLYRFKYRGDNFMIIGGARRAATGLNHHNYLTRPPFSHKWGDYHAKVVRLLVLGARFLSFRGEELLRNRRAFSDLTYFTFSLL